MIKIFLRTACPQANPFHFSSTIDTNEEECTQGTTGYYIARGGKTYHIPFSNIICVESDPPNRDAWKRSVAPAEQSIPLKPKKK
jgi:hypothetical protein